MTGGALTPAQRLYNILSDLAERTEKAKLPVFHDALKDALELLKEVDPYADPGEHVPDRTYGGPERIYGHDDRGRPVEIDVERGTIIRDDPEGDLGDRLTWKPGDVRPVERD